MPSRSEHPVSEQRRKIWWARISGARKEEQQGQRSRSPDARSGTPNPRALAFLVAKSPIDEGHQVTLFLAGGAVQLIRDAVLDNLVRQGTSKLRELHDATVAGEGRSYLSGMSSKARGVGESDLSGKPAEMALPNVLVRLALEHDRMFTC